MTKSIVQKLYEYERKNGKTPSLVVVGYVQYHTLEVERYRKTLDQKSPCLYLGGGVYIESIMGVKLIKDRTLDGVYFAEEQVLE